MANRSWGLSRSVLSLLSLACVPALAAAQTQADGTAERPAKLEGVAASAQTAGDDGWMLVRAALVLFMTGPGHVAGFNAGYAGGVALEGAAGD